MLSLPAIISLCCHIPQGQVDGLIFLNGFIYEIEPFCLQLVHGHMVGIALCQAVQPSGIVRVFVEFRNNGGETSLGSPFESDIIARTAYMFFPYNNFSRICPPVTPPASEGLSCLINLYLMKAHIFESFSEVFTGDDLRFYVQIL